MVLLSCKSLVEMQKGKIGGLGADVVIELSGSPAALKNAFASVRKGGRVTLFGLSAKPVQEFDFNYNIILRQVRVHGVAGRHMWDTWYVLDGLMKTGRLDPRPVITDVLPLEKFDEGFQKLTTGSPDALKVILKPWDSTWSHDSFLYIPGYVDGIIDNSHYTTSIAQICYVKELDYGNLR